MALSRSSHRGSGAFRSLLSVVGVAILLVGVVFAASGCGKASGLVGKWYSASEADTIVFAADGKMTVTKGDGTTLEYTYTAKDGNLTVSVMGQSATTTYTLDGDTLTVVNLDTQKANAYVRVK